MIHSLTLAIIWPYIRWFQPISKKNQKIFKSNLELDLQAASGLKKKSHKKIHKFSFKGEKKTHTHPPKSDTPPFLVAPACNDCTHKGLSRKLAWKPRHHLSTMEAEVRSRCEDSLVSLWHMGKPADDHRGKGVPLFGSWNNPGINPVKHVKKCRHVSHFLKLPTVLQDNFLNLMITYVRLQALWT